MNQNARYNCEKIYIQGDSGGIVNIFGDNIKYTGCQIFFFLQPMHNKCALKH